MCLLLKYSSGSSPTFQPILPAYCCPWPSESLSWANNSQTCIAPALIWSGLLAMGPTAAHRHLHLAVLLSLQIKLIHLCSFHSIKQPPLLYLTECHPHPHRQPPSNHRGRSPLLLLWHHLPIDHTSKPGPADSLPEPLNHPSTLSRRLFFSCLTSSV